MSDNWDDVQAGWDAAIRAVDAPAGRSSHVRAGKAGPGLVRHTIAFTGEPGAGKTMLFQALSEGGVRLGGQETRKSLVPELGHSNLVLGSLRIRVSALVVPGQVAQERDRAMTSILSEHTSPTGIIHVVCWGHNKVWNRPNQNVMERAARDSSGALTPEAIRAWHLEKELADFETLCERINETRAAQRSLRWMIVAVSKADLFWDRIDDARDYYVPGFDAAAHPPTAESGFSTALRDLADHNDIRIAVVPISSQLLRHSFSDSLRPRLSQLDSTGVGALLDHFYRTLKELM
ncbi:hypothetical protein [Streptomyces triticiradicis]|uniref:Uncharacterized protein n=1 Tax=Streptomyces triticiradicis TaxID=2651189 RepID=A0A7J5DI31_9ACTN|nr:hypothetical protein [Streptomyces triticiradicis]KAB1988310.1 hypothetical protein F8144_14020 [Streptomyces triticiradicis]